MDSEQITTGRSTDSIRGLSDLPNGHGRDGMARLYEVWQWLFESMHGLVRN